eukprot:COSAG02_NODE_5952_length_3917_cov_2.449974_1_plen_134_part_00
MALPVEARGVGQRLTWWLRTKFWAVLFSRLRDLRAMLVLLIRALWPFFMRFSAPSRPHDGPGAARSCCLKITTIRVSNSNCYDCILIYNLSWPAELILCRRLVHRKDAAGWYSCILEGRGIDSQSRSAFLRKC